MAAYKQSVAVIHKTTSIQENASAASLRVAWNLAKVKKPFTDDQLIQTCAIEMVEEVLNHDYETGNGRGAITEGAIIRLHDNKMSRDIGG